MKTYTDFKTTKAQATAIGKAILKRIRHKGFTLKVWENLGWHYSMDNGHFSISSTSVNGHFMCMLMPHYCIYGEVLHGRDVNRLLERAMHSSRKSLMPYILQMIRAEKSLRQ